MIIFNVQPPKMKKIFSALVLLSVAAACSHKSIPISNTPATSATKPDSKVALEGTTAASTTAMIEQGHTVYTTKCGKCHGLKNTADYTADAWEPIVHRMAPKAKLSEVETDQVMAYVKANAKK